MIDYAESLKKCQTFFDDCYEFWIREGFSPQEATKRASEETLNLKHDPFTPSGDLIDEQAKTDAVKSRRE